MNYLINYKQDYKNMYYSKKYSDYSFGVHFEMKYIKIIYKIIQGKQTFKTFLFFLPHSAVIRLFNLKR